MYSTGPRVFYFCKICIDQISYRSFALCKRVVVHGFNYTPEYETLYKEYYSTGDIIEIETIYKLTEKEEKEYVQRKLYWHQNTPYIEVRMIKKEETKKME